MESFSTVGLPVSRKVSYWNELSTETFAAMQVVPGARERFDGRLCREVAGPLILGDVCSAAASIHHTQAHAANAVDQRYILVLPLLRGFQVSIGRQPAFPLGVGEFCLLDQSRPYRLAFDQFTRTFAVVLTHRSLADLIPDPQAVAGRLMRPVHGMSRLLVSLLQNLSRELERGETAITPAFAHSLTGFIAAAYAEVADVAETSVLEARKRSIVRYIDEQLHDPQLRPGTIARQFGISPRYLRLMFAADGEPVSALILRRRLETCARLLRDPAWRGRTITDIAFRNGFNNATHFGYAFKRHFGLTPRDYRHASPAANP